MRIQRALVVALMTAALGSAMAGPVDVGYSVSGAPGAWQVDFTFANNLSSPVSLYFVGVKSDGFLDTPLPPFIRAFGSTFNTSDAGGLDITYNNLWLDLGLTGLPKGHSLSGFTVDFLTPSLPLSFEWFAMTRGGRSATRSTSEVRRPPATRAWSRCRCLSPKRTPCSPVG